jgi:hypothetical protein
MRTSAALAKETATVARTTNFENIRRAVQLLYQREGGSSSENTHIRGGLRVCRIESTVAQIHSTMLHHWCAVTAAQLSTTENSCPLPSTGMLSSIF